MATFSGRCCLGIDIGGTSAKLAVVGEQGSILRRTGAPMGRSLGAEEMLQALSMATQDLLDWTTKSQIRLEGIGVGHPGFYDDQGRLKDLCNLPSLNGVNLAAFLGRQFGLHATADTDVSCGTLGEFHFGNHQGVRRFLFLTLGTGVGAGVVIDGRLMRITRNCLGDPGHVIVDPDGTPCTCGGHGCLEAVVSGWAIGQQGERAAAQGRSVALSEILSRHGKIEPHDVFAAARGADSGASDVVNSVAKYLAMGLASISIIFEPERIVLGGGIAVGAGDQLLNPVRENFFRMLQPAFSRNSQIMTATVGPDAGVLGAASLIFRPES